MSAYQLGRQFSGDLNTSVWETWSTIGQWIMNLGNWILNIQQNITNLSITLLNELYSFLMLIALQTPLFLFTSSYLTDTTKMFSGVSVIIVIILTMFEGFKRKFKKKHNDLTTISKRWVLAILGSGSAPFLFENVFRFLNYLSSAITEIGKAGLSSQEELNNVILNNVHVGFLILFDIVLIALIVPLILQNFRRWLDLMCLSAITPLALSAWVFDEHRHHFHNWWRNVKKLSMVQIIYAFFICMMGLFIFGTSNTISGSGLLIKTGLIIGGLHRMCNPPSFVKSRLDNGEDIVQLGENMKKSQKGVLDTVTFKKYPFISSKLKVASAVINQIKKK